MEPDAIRKGEGIGCSDGAGSVQNDGIISIHMSLMRLLSAGKSLVGVRDNGSRYRMGNPGMLPRFGSQKNPFARGQKGNVETDETGPKEASIQTVIHHEPSKPSLE